LVDALRLSTLQNTGLIDSALKSLKPFALSLSKGQFKGTSTGSARTELNLHRAGSIS
jgi:hypothetical protein